MSALTIETVVATAAASSSVDIRPPAGEVWILHMANCPGTGTTDVGTVSVYDSVGAISVGTIYQNAASGGVQNVSRARLPLTNAVYVRVNNTSAASVTVTALCSLYTGPGSMAVVICPVLGAFGTYDVRPPAGETWVVRGVLHNLSNSNASVQLTDSSATATVVPNSYQNNIMPVSLPINNSLWVRWNWAGSSSMAAPGGCLVVSKLPSSILDIYKYSVANLANGSVVDFRPPVGETWVVEAAVGQASSWTVCIGGTFYKMVPPSGGASSNSGFPVSYYLGVPIDNGVYFRTSPTVATTTILTALKLQ